LFLRIFAFAYRNWIFAKRNFFAFFELLFWPVVGLISVGLMGGFLKLTPQLLNFVLTGAITAGTLQVVQLDVAYGLLYDVWSKSLKHSFLAPISHFHFLAGSWIIGIVRGMIVFALMAGFSAYAFEFSLPSVNFTVAFFLGICLSAFIIGMLVNLLVMLYGQRVEVTAWAFASLIMLICGIYYPVSQLPKAVQFISQFIPLTYFMEYFRLGYGFTPVYTHLLLKGFGLCVIYIVLLYTLLNVAYKRSRKTGMILRLSE
jgi:ABC-2 type transport system permease protein